MNSIGFLEVKFTDHRLPASKCPTCNYKLDAATGMDGTERPEPGSIMICLNCAEILELDQDLKAIPLRAETIDEMTGEELMQMAKSRTAVLTFLAEHKGKKKKANP